MSGIFNNRSMGICIEVSSMMIDADHNIMGQFTAINKEPKIIPQGG